MKKTMLLFLGLFFSSWGNSQSLSPEIIATAGSYDSGVNAQISWTIGETLVKTYSNGPNLLTQGFHQSNLVLTDVEDLAKDIRVNVFPNPTANRLNIEWSEPIDGQTLTLSNLSGRQLLIQQIFNQTLMLDLSSYPAGTYFFRLSNSENKTIKTFKILKIK